MGNRRMARAIWKRRIKIVGLSLLLAIFIWFVVSIILNQVKSDAEQMEVFYQETVRVPSNSRFISTTVRGCVVRTTAYCSCEKCCGEWANKRDGNVVGASGVELVPGYSIAADRTLYNYGDIVTIEGMDYRVDDCGGAIKGLSFDIYMDSHEKAIEYGRQYRILEVLED